MYVCMYVCVCVCLDCLCKFLVEDYGIGIGTAVMLRLAEAFQLKPFFGPYLNNLCAIS